MQRRHRPTRGFTLIELLVVLLILGMIAGLAGPQIMGYLGDSKSKTAKLQITEFEGTLDLFKLDVGRYPDGQEGLQALATAGLTSFALEAAPRTSRAQSMDVLSSQANIAGYKAVMIAADRYQRFFPMLMTAAGTVKAARVVILGVGVAGLQAIATAKRLGAVIEATDVRPSVKEQVESLGGKFIDVPYETQEEKDAAEGVGGYARPMPPSWLDRQKVEVKF